MAASLEDGAGVAPTLPGQQFSWSQIVDGDMTKKTLFTNPECETRYVPEPEIGGFGDDTLGF